MQGIRDYGALSSKWAPHSTLCPARLRDLHERCWRDSETQRWWSTPKKWTQQTQQGARIQCNWVSTHKNWAIPSGTKRYHGQGKVGEKSHQLLRTAWRWRAGTGRQFRLILSSHVSQPHSRVSSTPIWLVQNLLGNLNWTLCVGGWVGRHPSWLGKDVRVWRVGMEKVGGGK